MIGVASLSLAPPLIEVFNPLRIGVWTLERHTAVVSL